MADDKKQQTLKQRSRGYIANGIAKMGGGNYQGAIEDFTKAIKLRPDYIGAYTIRGIVCNKVGNYQQAFADCNEMIELDPNYAEAYAIRGSVNSNLGNYQQALADCNEAIRLSPSYAAAYASRGSVNSNLGNYQQAITDFDTAIKLNPDYAEAYASRGVAYNKLGNYQQALDNFDTAIKLDPSNADKLKKTAALRALELIKDGMRLGLGTGSTARHFIDGLGAKVAAGLNVVCVATSKETHAQAASLNIPLVELDEVPKLDLTIDGADELTPNLHLIKGGGGALLREKIVATASDAMLVIADERKLVNRLGAFPLPIEVTKLDHMAISQNIAAAIREVQGKDAPQPEPILRGGKSPFITDNGNYIYDYALQQINDPPALAAALEKISGVKAHGLFIDIANSAIISHQNGLTEI